MVIWVSPIRNTVVWLEWRPFGLEWSPSGVDRDLSSLYRVYGTYPIYSFRGGTEALLELLYCSNTSTRNASHAVMLRLPRRL